MDLIIDSNTVVVFDLDDTLYKEVDFLKSAYRHISRKISLENWEPIFNEMFSLWKNKEAVFDIIHDKYKLDFSIKEMVYEYRFHKPTFELSKGVGTVLESLKSNEIKMGLLTDGRSETQRNKLESLGIKDYFDLIVISEEFGSEKPNEKNYTVFQNHFPQSNFIYIGDNFKKDFVTANALGWETIGLLDAGENIHSQKGDFGSVYLPKKTIPSFLDININYQ